ncbi:MAG TPA: serine/threonine-protein kinase [Solirubrobacteraceae bacterium]|jgi:serine/threonine protein kinase|nr:serine/threonine-protein kinase [Solirubrobacteraceae bacterium]
MGDPPAPSTTVSDTSDGDNTSTRRVGRYEIVQELGKGGMATVYLARQVGLGRVVALKELSAFQANRPGVAERFVRESQLAGSLNHANIVTVYEYFEEAGTPYIAMEYVQYGSLRPRIGSLSITQVLGVLEGVLAGLAHAETFGIVHRDLKPENIMVALDGHVKLADYGIAKASASAGVERFATSPGALIGTPAYMAPEQALGGQIGPCTDLYSLGVVAYEQIVGRVPFADTHSPLAVAMRHANEPVPPVTEARPETDQGLSGWIGRLLLKEPDARPRSATAAWEELEEIAVRIAGPLWRRDARLTAPEPYSRPPRTLTPAEFGGDTANPAAGTGAGDAPVRGSTWFTSPRATLALLAAALVGFGIVKLTTDGDGSGTAPLDRSASSGSFSVRYPAPWSATGPGLLSTLGTPAPIVLVAHSGADRLAIGLDTKIDSPALLPPSIVGESRPEAVGLGGNVFLRRHLAAGRTASAETLYGLLTDDGTLLAECNAGSQSAAADCERILASLRLNGRSPLDYRPDDAYAAALNSAIAALGSRAGAPEAALRHATTRFRQAGLAGRISAAYAVTATTIAGLHPGSGAQSENTGIAAALTRVALGYAALGRAARAGSGDAFRAARRTVAAGAADLARGYADLRNLGYVASP